MSSAHGYEDIAFHNGAIRLHAVAAGPQHGPLLLLLHGFPEFWYGWRHQIAPLAEAGFRVIAPDQRGYNTSSKPASIAAYAVSELAADVIAILDQLGRQRACIVGHDWGALVAWNVALTHPDRVTRLVILNVPHPTVMERNLRTNPRQWLKSWYGLLFQIPWLPEVILSARNYRIAKFALVRSSRHGSFTPDGLARHAQAWSEPGAMTAMINWYRALSRYSPNIVDPQLRVPTRLLWGKNDAFLLAGEAQESLHFCPGGDLIYFEEATHWIQHDEPDRVNQLVIEWFKRQDQDIADPP
jgi:pimeloyl-ACP methyl ester carboxylesterase